MDVAPARSGLASNVLDRSPVCFSQREEEGGEFFLILFYCVNLNIIRG